MEDKVTERSRQFGSVLRLDFPGFVVLGVFPASIELIYLLLALALYLKKAHMKGKTMFLERRLAELESKVHLLKTFYIRRSLQVSVIPFIKSKRESIRLKVLAWDRINRLSDLQ